MADVRYLNYEGLQVYDELIKGVISDGDAKALKTFQYDEATRTLKFFKSEAPEADAVADFTMTLPADQDLSGLLEKIDGGVVGNVVTVGEGGTVVDSGIAVDALATKEEVEAVDDKVDANAAKITTLVGEDTDKSVRTIANEELAKQLIADGAKESLDTLEEIAAWIQSHPDDAAAMNKAIDDLEALVGTLPEGVTATDIVGYIQEVVAAEKTRAEGVEAGLDTRLKAVEEAVGEGGSVETQIGEAIAGLDADVTSDAVEEGKGVQVQVVEVDGKVTTVAVTGNYDNAYDAKGAAATAETNANKYTDDKLAEFTAISEDDINALFATGETV